MGGNDVAAWWPLHMDEDFAYAVLGLSILLCFFIVSINFFQFFNVRFAVRQFELALFAEGSTHMSGVKSKMYTLHREKHRIHVFLLKITSSMLLLAKDFCHWWVESISRWWQKRLSVHSASPRWRSTVVWVFSVVAVHPHPTSTLPTHPVPRKYSCDSAKHVWNVS